MKNKTPHPENFCWQCGNPNPNWYAPNELWNKVCDNKGDVICPKCFQEEAKKQGISILFTTELTEEHLKKAMEIHNNKK